MTEADRPCPCGQERTYTGCCGRFHRGEAWPESPTELMRSRYTAFAVGEIPYLISTLEPSKRAGVVEKDLREWSNGSEWLGLRVIDTEGGGAEEDEGTVEFEAHYRVKDSGEEVHHHELATFRRREGRWFFHDGKIRGQEPIQRTEPRVGRNDPCPCGSGKKFKKCCSRVS